MKASRALAAIFVLLAITMSAVARSTTAPSQVLLRDVQASKSTVLSKRACPPGKINGDCVQLDTEIEPSIAVNPSNPLNAVTAFQDGRRDAGGAAAMGYATTFDGGKTWTQGDLPRLTTSTKGTFGLASDAVVAFGPNNTVYANSLLLEPSQISVNISHDGGRTWGKPVIILTLPTDNVDKNWIVVDNSKAPGHHYGRVYCVWDTVAPVWVAYSDDEGKTWQTGPSGAGFVVYAGQGIGSYPLVMPNGDLAVMFTTDFFVPSIKDAPGDEIAEPITGLTKFVVVIAKEAGTVPTGAPLVFTPPVTAGTWKGRVVDGQRAGEDLAAAAVDAKTGTIYVSWADARHRKDNMNYNDIVVTASKDGIRWSLPVRVSHDPITAPVERWCPMIAVGPSGDVRVAYRQRLHPSDEGYIPLFYPDVDTYFVRSQDGAVSFGAPLKVDTTVSDMAYAAMSRGGAFLGDYDQIAVAGSLSYIVRAEPFRLSKSEPRRFPPLYHHQRMWVAVVRT